MAGSRWEPRSATSFPRSASRVAARWTGRAWSLASRLDDAALQGHVLRMHGNELRKAGHVPAAIARLSQAAAMTTR